MEIMLEALQILLSPKGIAIISISVITGTIIGAAPGLTSTMAIGLLIPITFTMSKYTAFMVMCGIYCGAMFGGSITAILMNIPGTPTSAVTAIDGWPMTQKGEGGKAIGVATLSSTIGGLLSCIAFITCSLYLAKVAIMFGNAEYFSLTLFAICVVIVLATKSIMKGLISSAFGLLIGTMGIDPVAQIPRFTFGVTELLIGMPAVPACIGLFCVAEAFRMAETKRKKVNVQKKVSGLMIAIRLLPRLWTTILKSSVIGIIIGALPATGALMGSFIAYGEAKRKSKNPELFGKGSVEGVCASESANNAVTGGAMIPMLTLGIPGDPSTLLMLGAMTVQGLIPGPTLFNEQPTLVYVILGAMILSNIIFMPTGLFLSTHIAKVALIDYKYIMPIIAVLSITGASIGYGHIYYFWISVGFGVLGYLCDKAGFSPLAIAMTMILGPIMEVNYRSALMLPDSGIFLFLSRPISMVFIVLSILVIGFGIRRELIAYRSAKA